MTVCYIDTETTGLHPEQHEIWECALIEEDGTEHVWQLPVDLGRADPIALEIGEFHNRRASAEDRVVKDGSGKVVLTRMTPNGFLTPVDEFAAEFAVLTRGCHLVGAVVSFDAERLSRLLRSNGACPEWHYHLVDVEALAVGFLAARPPAMLTVPSNLTDAEAEALADAWRSDRQPTIVAADNIEIRRVPMVPPWKSEDLSRALGVDPNEFDKHTALGDARWARAMYEKVMGA